MHKSLTIASTEFTNYVRTKAFIISILVATLLPTVMVTVQRMIDKQADTTERRFAVIDRTGVVAPAIVSAAEAWNASVGGPKPTGPRYVPIVASGNDTGDGMRVSLSQRVARNELFAFVEIPAAVLDDQAVEKLRYYSNHPSYAALPLWIQRTVSAHVQGLRLRDANLDAALVARLTRPVPMDEMGLVERDANGQVRAAAKVDKIRTVAVPVILMMLIFMPVMVICPQLVQSVLEEKMSRISEVLLGSVTPFELMLGKLLGAGCVCVVMTLMYVGAAAIAAVYWGYADVIDPRLIVEFIIFLALAMLLYGSLYIAVGAAATTLKDSQSLMMPVMMLSMIPIFAMSAIMRAPDGPVAIGFSLFPPSAPYLMMFRLATHPGPPFWQVPLAVVLTAATAVGGVWAAGRIFRVGLLAQGKAPSFGELIKWVKA